MSFLVVLIRTPDLLEELGMIIINVEIVNELEFKSE
jgi:hypothetical protein